MNKIEAGLGAAIVLLTFSYILFLNQGVVRLSSGYYVYRSPSELAGHSFWLLLILGPVVIVHAALTRRFVELGLGMSITIWTFFVWVCVISIYFINYSEVGYIREFPSSHDLTWLCIAPNALWGAFLAADGVLSRQKTKP